MKRTTSLFLLGLALAGCSDDESTVSPLDAAAAAMGGEEAIRAVAAVRIDATGQNLDAQSQGRTPTSDPIQASSYEASLLAALDGSGEREDWHVETEYFFPPATYDYTEVSSDGAGWVDGKDGLVPGPTKAGMPSSRVAAAHKESLLENPLALLQRALAERDTVATLPDETFDGRLHHVLALPGEASPLRLFVDAESGVLDKADTLEDSAVRGDTLYEAVYADWRTAGDVLVPYRVSQRLNGLAFHDELRSAVDTRPAIEPGSFDVPADLATPFDQDLASWGERSSHWLRGFQAIGLPLYLVQSAVQSTEVVPGVVWLGGGSHHSLVVELGDHLLLVEAPLYEARAQAVVDEAAELFPGKPITQIVSTHHHHDHSGGVRAALALTGADLVVGAPLETFFTDMLRAPHTVHPDALSASDATPAITAVSEPLELGDASRQVLVLPVPTSHADGMLVVWLPTEGILFESDLFSPGFYPPGPIPESEQAAAAGELLDWIDAQSLPVQTIVGGHGFALGTLAELQGAVGS
jgi:glyoxylase-like metal-dependent hydrolase (beta-lactamase superfamily II)